MEKIKMKHLIFLLIFISGCIDPYNHEIVDHSLSQEIKDYTVFPIGSNWVYFDSLSGIEDSIYITNLEQHYFQRAEDFNRYEHYFSSCYSSFQNTTFSRAAMVMDGQDNSVYFDNNIIKFVSNLPLGLNGEGIYYHAFFDSIFIRNSIYHEVKVFYQPLDTSYYYFAKNIGLIKERTKTAVKELDHYHINY